MPPITTGLALWLDASDTASMQVFDDGVFNWNDKVGGLAFYHAGVSWPQLNTTYFPRPCVNFGDGSSSVWMTADAAVNISRPATIFFVVYWPATDRTYAALSLQDSFGSSALRVPESASSVYMFRAPSLPGAAQISIAPYLPEGQVYTPASVSSNAGHVVTFQAAVAPADSGIRFDGVAQTVATEGPTHYPVMSFDTIGSSDELYLANGAFAEILVYDGALSTTDIQSIEAYLTAKWSSAGGGTDVDVDASGVAGSTALGGLVVSAGAGAAATGAALQSGLGSVVVSASGQTTVFGVEADAAVSQVLVWSAVNDTQSTGWTPVNTAQGSPWLGVGPGTVAVTEFDGPGSAAIASEPLAGSSSFSYTPSAVVWRPVLTSA